MQTERVWPELANELKELLTSTFKKWGWTMGDGVEGKKRGTGLEKQEETDSSNFPPGKP